MHAPSPDAAQAPEAEPSRAGTLMWRTAGDLPRRDQAAWRGAPVRLTATPVTPDLAIRIVTGLYPGWDAWRLGGLYIAMPEGDDALTSPAVVNATSLGEIIVRISQAAGAR